MIVLDASAVLAALLDERGADRVRASMHDAAIGAVNFAEVISRLVDRAVPEDRIALTVDGLRSTVVPFDAAQAAQAGRLRRNTRHLGLSLGDRACLALALSLGAPVLTADRTWADLELGVEIEVIG